MVDKLAYLYACNEILSIRDKAILTEIAFTEELDIDFLLNLRL